MQAHVPQQKATRQMIGGLRWGVTYGMSAAPISAVWMGVTCGMSIALIDVT